jgi:hypothetical protein
MSNFDVVASHGALIPSIGLGTWTLKGEACAEAVAGAIACGYRHIDTAKMYENEEGVGQGIRAAKVARHDLFVTTKVWKDDIVGDFSVGGSKPEAPRPRLCRSAAGSLAQRRIPSLDQRFAGEGARPHATSGVGRPECCSGRDCHCQRADRRQPKSTIAPRPSKVTPVAGGVRLAFVSCAAGRGSVGGVIDEPVVQAMAALKRWRQVVLRWHVQQGLVPRLSNSGA